MPTRNPQAAPPPPAPQPAGRPTDWRVLKAMDAPPRPPQQQPAAAAATTANTCVCVRLRPPSAQEQGARCIRGDAADGKRVQFAAAGGGSLLHDGYSLFEFDGVFGEDLGQGDVFRSCSHVVDGVLAGVNGTIMTYGQTGSGKTHTLIGSLAGEQRGLVPRAVEALGAGITADASGARFDVRLSVVEIYCERIRCLLDPSRDNLAVKQDAAGAIFIEGALEAQVGGEEQLVAVMQRGLAARTTAATCMNATSSRSHCIVTLTVEKACADGSVLVGKLKLVDLAGSERQDKTLAAGQVLVEGSQINKSLSALANVIYALTDSSSGCSSGNGGGNGGAAAGGGGADTGGRHVPYRDSKLTRVLQDSLGGTSRTVLIVCCSPCCENAAETLSSLRFGSRARGLKNTVAVNVRLDPKVVQQQLEAAREQVKLLQQQLEAERQRGATASSSLPAAPASAPDQPAADGCVDDDDAASGGSAADVNDTCPIGASPATTTISSLLWQPLPWWQHALSVALTAASVGAYAAWEQRMSW